MSQSFTNLLYHLIFSTKDRRPIITLDYQPRLYDYIGGIIRELGGVSLGINGIEDHVHVVTKLRPDKALSDVLRVLGNVTRVYGCTTCFQVWQSFRGNEVTPPSR